MLGGKIKDCEELKREIHRNALKVDELLEILLKGIKRKKPHKVPDKDKNDEDKND